MQLNWLKTTWSKELAPKTVFVAISSARVSKTASHQDLLTVIIVASFSACMFLFWLLFVVDDWKTIAFCSGCHPTDSQKGRRWAGRSFAGGPLVGAGAAQLALF